MRLVTPDQIATAMREEAETGRPIAEIVVANGWVTAEDLARLQAPAVAPPAAVAPATEPVAAAPVAEPAPAPSAAPTVTAEPVTAEPDAPTAEAQPAPMQPAPRPDLGARVLVRLANGERIEVGQFDGFDAAKERARDLMAELRQAAEWPFLRGRYVRPDAIVSIDIDVIGF
jgi:hypothetical protein